MTLNCDLGIDEARENFVAAPGDASVRDYVESAFEHWCADQISDGDFGTALAEIASFLKLTGTPAIGIAGSRPERLPVDDLTAGELREMAAMLSFASTGAAQTNSGLQSHALRLAQRCNQIARLLDAVNAKKA